MRMRETNKPTQHWPLEGQHDQRDAESGEKHRGTPPKRGWWNKVPHMMVKGRSNAKNPVSAITPTLGSKKSTSSP